MRTGRFREDLYYRIHVIPIQLPPLSERNGDISLLCEYFLEVHCVANGLPVKRLAADALAALEEHAWPGNVRELENLIQRLVVTVRGDEIVANDLPPACWRRALPRRRPSWCRRKGPISMPRFAAGGCAAETALRRTGGSKAAAARLLNIDRQRMKYLCRKYSL